MKWITGKKLEWVRLGGEGEDLTGYVDGGGGNTLGLGFFHQDGTVLSYSGKMLALKALAISGVLPKATMGRAMVDIDCGAGQI